MLPYLHYHKEFGSAHYYAHEEFNLAHEEFGSCSGNARRLSLLMT
jgi:hypothetical protein